MNFPCSPKSLLSKLPVFIDSLKPMVYVSEPTGKMSPC